MERTSLGFGFTVLGDFRRFTFNGGDSLGWCVGCSRLGSDEDASLEEHKASSF